MNRRVRLALAVLAVGVVLNVTVAWMCAAWLEPPSGEYTSSFQPGRYWAVRWREGVGLTLVTSSWSSGWGRGKGRPPIAVDRHLPNWAAPTPPDPSLDVTVESQHIDSASGWPYLAMASGILIRFRDDPPQTLTVETSGIAIGPLGINEDSRAYPLRPIWPGFALNTLFYTLVGALFWFGFIEGSRRFCRLIRRMRGHCQKCGYDLRNRTSMGCPECGWRRQEKVSRPSP